MSPAQAASTCAADAVMNGSLGGGSGWGNSFNFIAGDVFTWSITGTGSFSVTVTGPNGYNLTVTSSQTDTITYVAPVSGNWMFSNSMGSTTVTLTSSCNGHHDATHAPVGTTIATSAAKSTQYVAPKVMASATTAIGTLIGTNVRGAFSRVGGGVQGRSSVTALAGASAPEIVLADASGGLPRANADGGGLRQGLLGGKLGGFAEMSYSHLRSREAGGEYVGDVKNGVAGLDYKLRDDLLIGVAAGYEFTDFTTIYNRGWLDGEGLTLAPYLGYAFSNFVLDVTVGRSWLNYKSMRGSGAAAYGSYDASREFVTSNLTATYGWQGLRLAPTAGLLFARETADSYTDSTGTRQEEITSKMGRASLGGEIGRPMDVSAICVCSFEPFIKAKLNYDFLHDGQVILANGQLSAVNEVTGQLGGGIRLGYQYVALVIDGSYDTLGASDLEGWNVRGRVDFTLPF